MKLARTRSTAAAACALAALSLLTACNRDSSGSAGSGGDQPAIGIDLPRSDSDFWNSYADYLKKDIKTDGINALPLSNSQNDVTKLVANVQVFQNTGAKAVVMAPQ
ncbi:sugar ABC transporter substrate-binding protein, partial [Streptomyces ipomoeae]|nr:sugar ABC transporter substrate-binding protein [Streptomyces ipomoeae]